MSASGPGQRRGIVTGGTWCVDRNRLVDFWPAEEAVAEILEVELQGGGSGCNLAIDIRRLDPSFPIATIGVVGDDDDGRFLIAEADAHGIDRRQLQTIGGVATHYTDAYASRRSGRRTHIYFQGSSGCLTPDHFDFAATEQRILHLGLPGVHKLMDAPWNGEANGWVATLKQARAAGLETNLELCSIPPERQAALVRPCLPQLDYLVVNDGEIGAIAGLPTIVEGRTELAACIAAARAALAAGAMRIVVVHFPGGGVAVERDGTVTVKPSVAVPKDAVAGANGAGDAFAAGFLYGTHEGWPVERSLALAHAVAAASLRGMTTTGTVEPWADCLALAERWGWRPAIG
jgi:sugar/nucleoside kinase (ribokinase family)